MTRRDSVLLALIVLIGALLRVPVLGEGFWRDEASTYYDIAARGLDGTLRMIARIELAPPAYFLVEKAWGHIAGVGDVALKLPSFVYGIALIVVVYFLGRNVASSAVGLLAALFAAVSQPAIALSAEARVYAFAGLAAALTLVAYVAAQRRPSAALLAWFIVAGTVLVYANYAGCILLGLLGIATFFVVLRRDDRARRVGFAVAFLTIVLLYAPWIPTMVMHARIGAPFQERTRLGTFFDIVNNDFGNLLPFASRHGQIGLAFALGALVWLAFMLVRRMQRDSAAVSQSSKSTPIPVIVAILAFCTVAGACIGALLSLREPRYLFVFAPGAWVWFGWLTCRLGQWSIAARRWQQVALGAVIIMLVALFIPTERRARSMSAYDSSGIRDFAPRGIALARDDRTVFLAIPDYLAPTLGYYVGRVSDAEIHGFARWQDPQIFVTRDYLQVWTDPGAVSDVENRIASVMQRYDHLVVIRDAILIDRARMPYTRANVLLTWVRNSYRLVSSREYPGREEDVIVGIFQPRKSAKHRAAGRSSHAPQSPPDDSRAGAHPRRAR
ncbi:MAG: glycosyltransferase family 39 protein [Candidatus Eremiobacteraeota bacterium]|nr:glycosyltransferase family 39 protein [Candidatus Eremiobacteraeota bacterium]